MGLHVLANENDRVTHVLLKLRHCELCRITNGLRFDSNAHAIIVNLYFTLTVVTRIGQRSVRGRELCVK